MNRQLLSMLYELANNVLSSHDVESFVRLHKPPTTEVVSEYTKSLVFPWISLAPALVQLGSVLTANEFVTIVDQSLSSNKLITGDSAAIVIAAIDASSFLYERSSDFETNLRYLKSSVTASVGADPYHLGEFRCD